VASTEEPVPESLARRLRRLRTDRGLSQRDLSSPGVSYAYVSRIEAGTRQPSVKALRMLARKLHVSVDYLETGSELRDVDERELRLADAELELRMGNDPDAAEAALRQLLREAIEAGDATSAVRARIGLGLAAADSRPDEAIELLAPVVQDGSVPASTRPDIYATLGQAYARTGRPERAVELFERCLEEVGNEVPDDVSARVRYASYLSFALTDMGSLAKAEQVLRDVLESVDTMADPYTRVRVYWSLGRLASARGEASSALSFIRRAIALLEVTDDTLHLARAHLLCAWTLLNNGRPEEAGEYLDTAERLFGTHGERKDLAGLRTEQARRAAALGDGEQAVERAREALELYDESDPGERGIASRALAEGRALRGEVANANAAFEQAVGLLEQAGRFQEAAQAARAWGRTLREHGQESQALDVLERAAELGTRAQPTEARAGA
jgi:tetratricopeptide (TPR) repeat protein